MAMCKDCSWRKSDHECVKRPYIKIGLSQKACSEFRREKGDGRAEKR